MTEEITGTFVRKDRWAKGLAWEILPSEDKHGCHIMRIWENGTFDYSIYDPRVDDAWRPATPAEIAEAKSGVVPALEPEVRVLREWETDNQKYRLVEHLGTSVQVECLIDRGYEQEWVKVGNSSFQLEIYLAGVNEGLKVREIPRWIRVTDDRCFEVESIGVSEENAIGGRYRCEVLPNNIVAFGATYEEVKKDV